MKKFIPDFKCFGSINWARPAVGPGNWTGTVLALLSVLMLVAVFLPWFHWEYTVPVKDDVTTLEAFNKLGITTVWGILGLVVTLVALFGALYKQYAFTFWAAVLAFVFGCLGTNTIAEIELTVDKQDYIIFKESLKSMQLTDELIPATHIGANLFMIGAAVLAALSLTQLFKKDEEAEAGCIAKLALAVSAFVAFVICLDAALVTPSFLSAIAMKMLVWNLPLIAALLVAFAFVKGEGKALNCVSVALLAVAFFFTNPATIETKYAINEKHDIENIMIHDDKANDPNVLKSTEAYKEQAKALKKLVEKQNEDDKVQNRGITQWQF